MKKIILSLVSVMFLISTASAEIGVNIGVSGTTALFAATGSETNSSITVEDSDTEIGAGGYGSVFFEKELGRFAVGVDFTPKFSKQIQLRLLSKIKEQKILMLLLLVQTEFK